jgi:hypothetical protein
MCSVSFFILFGGIVIPVSASAALSQEEKVSLAFQLGLLATPLTAPPSQSRLSRIEVTPLLLRAFDDGDGQLKASFGSSPIT